MVKFIAKRLGWAAFVLWIVVSGVFVLTNEIGDPAAATLGPRAHPEQLQAFRRKHGLDRPTSERYVKYLGGIVRGDLGTSFRDGEPVTEVILTRLPRTILLGTLALGFELLIGIALGIIAAVYRNTLFDTGFMALAFVGISAPTFVTGVLFLNLFAFRAGWFPVGGFGIDPIDHLRHAMLPALTLAIVGAATYARIMRSEMIEALRSDFVRTARAKGASSTAVVLRHAARNALLPIVTMTGLSFPLLVSGALITEQIYAWPGMGRLAIESIYSLDLPMIMGVVLVASAAVQVGNVLADIAVASLDPRVRLEQS